MPTSAGKRILKWTILITPWLLALGLAAGWALFAWTPKYLERAVPRMAADMGVPLTAFNVRDAGLFSADIGPVQLGEGEDVLRISNVHITYTPRLLREARVNSVTIEGVSVNCTLDEAGFRLPVLALMPQSEDTTDDRSIPQLPLDSIAIRDANLICSIYGQRLTIPVSADMTPGKELEFSATLTPRDQRINMAGTLGPTLDDLRLNVETEGLHLGALADFMPVAVAGRMDIAVRTKLNLSKPDALTAEFETTMREADLSGLGVTLAEGQSIAAKGSLEDMTVLFTMEPVTLEAPFPATVAIQSGLASTDSISTQFTLNGAGVEMGGRFDAEKQENEWDVSLTAANPDKLDVSTEGRIVQLNGFIFSLQGTATPETADVVLNCATRGAALGRTGFRSGPLRLTLPLKWPAPKRHTPGKLTLSRLRAGTIKLGSLSARVRQQDTDIAFGGLVSTDLLPGLRIGFSGLASMVENFAKLDFDIDQYRLPDGFDPSSLVKGIKGATVVGTLDVDGAIQIDVDGLQSRVGAFFTDGTVTLADGATRISGVELAFESPGLYPLRSSPAQKLTFASLESGALKITDGEIIYQLEPGGVVLFEQAGFKWCGGKVSSRAFRVEVDSQRYAVTMFCSELKLSQILEQLGLAKAEGEAALSGELPVTWDRGKISFNNGFLHSTPGETGVIQVEAMQDLVAAIPEGTPQRGQIELAREAVRDFEYKWVRIKADTVGEDLLVRLSVDGKPRSTLPFVYRREFGGFMRVTGDVKGSNFQGLRLDVNFSVPLDRLLLYKDITKMIE